MKLHERYYKTLGIKEYHLVLSLRDPKNKKKYHGDEKMWKKAEKLLREACKKVDIPMVEDVGSAAFYGPKIDFVIKSSIGREFAISTNQIDLYMGKRFHLKYIDSSGKAKTPVIIHRAPLGSHERFVGFLIEHFAGAFPVWLSPLQVKILPISEKHNKYANNLLEKLRDMGIRAEVDSKSETLQAKIRDAQLEKVPYMFVVGDREEKDNKVAVRLRSEKDLGAQDFEEFSKKILKNIHEKGLEL
jgi:threonyl-tRNA synthetase